MKEFHGPFSVWFIWQPLSWPAEGCDKGWVFCFVFPLLLCDREKIVILKRTLHFFRIPQLHHQPPQWAVFDDVISRSTHDHKGVSLLCISGWLGENTQNQLTLFYSCSTGVSWKPASSLKNHLDISVISLICGSELHRKSQVLSYEWEGEWFMEQSEHREQLLANFGLHLTNCHVV